GLYGLQGGVGNAGAVAFEGGPAGLRLREGEVQAGGFEQSTGGGDDLPADAVARDQADGTHGLLLVVPGPRRRPGAEAPGGAAGRAPAKRVQGTTGSRLGRT